MCVRGTLILIPTPVFISETNSEILACVVNYHEQDRCLDCMMIYRTGIWDTRFRTVGFDDVIFDDKTVDEFVLKYDVDACTWNLGLKWLRDVVI